MIVGHIVFSGDLSPNPDAAAVALRKAGFTVARMPERFRPRLYHPSDDFMQATIGGLISDEYKVARAVRDEIDAIVDGFGGTCDRCDICPPDHALSFDELFEEQPRRN
jgi:hypothetical protein